MAILKGQRLRPTANENAGIPWPIPTDRDRARRNAQLLRQYGLTIEDYEGMIWLQDNRCAMCDKTFNENISPAVDHDHACCYKPYEQRNKNTCGKCVRGIVCGPCNRSLGFYESVKGSAERYLGKYGV